VNTAKSFAWLILSNAHIITALVLILHGALFWCLVCAFCAHVAAKQAYLADRDSAPPWVRRWMDK
jgi:hypothetical protein